MFPSIITAISILSVIVKHQMIMVQGRRQVPCLFFMGDSQVDNGNNNLLLTAAKANYYPYGVDYPKGATGRFSNGRNVPDFLAEFLGFHKPIPPFSTAKQILRGLNYGSGAAGILDETGSALGDRISMNRQLTNHRLTVARFSILLGSNAQNYLNKCLYIINMGSNDYLNNYFMPQYYQSSTEYTPDQFAEKLIQQYSLQLKTLYNLGGRKIAVFGLGLLGCIPQVLLNGSSCVDAVNNAAQLFNNRLKSLVDDLNRNLTGAQLILINATGEEDPATSGIRVTTAPCCKPREDGQCIPGQKPCSTRNEYTFWDNFHPSEISNYGTATKAYNSTLASDTYPMNISRLARQ